MKEADGPHPHPHLTACHWRTVFPMTFTVMTNKTHLYRVVLRWKGKTIVYKWKGCSTLWCFTWMASRRICVWDVCLPAFLFPQLCCGQRCLIDWRCPGQWMTNTTATRLTQSLWWSGCRICTSVPSTTFTKASVSLSVDLGKQSICVSLLFGEGGGRLPRFCSCVLKEKVPFLISFLNRLCRFCGLNWKRRRKLQLLA